MAAKNLSLSELHLCVDRVVPMMHKVSAAKAAIDENSANKPNIVSPPGVSSHPLKMALFTGKMWENGRALSVSCLDGSATQRKQAQKYAETWMAFANIQLAFGNKASADIRISFVADDGSWSGVGTDNLLREAFPADKPTMNFGWLRDDTEEDEWRRVVTHEFGHALGAIHEHQNPSGQSIKWNVPAVMAAFSGPPNNWSPEDIQHNILEKYNIKQLNATKFDEKSIMLYTFPAQLILGSTTGTPNNTRMSTGDKKFIAQMYPKGAAAKAKAKAAKPRMHPMFG